MIQKANAIETFRKNIERTDMLITAMEKIAVYNRIYQDKASEIDPRYGWAVTESQNKELRKIEQACLEHAVISIATAFETYYKELLQELLHSYPHIFLNKKTKYDGRIKKLLFDKNEYDYEKIGDELKLKNRFDYYDIFDTYSVLLFTPEEAKFIEYIYVKRNCFVHNAGKVDSKTKLKLKKTPSSTGRYTEKTYIKRMIKKVDERIKRNVRRKNKEISTR